MWYNNNIQSTFINVKRYENNGKGEKQSDGFFTRHILKN